MTANEAVVVHGPGDVGLESRSDDRPLREGEARVAIGVATLCHTDQYVVSGVHPTVRYPIVPGHEMSGTVVEVGPGRDLVAVGDRVAVATQIGCGQCVECTTDNVAYCPWVRELGASLDGGWQRTLIAPASSLHRLPGGMTVAQGALTEPSANAHAVTRRAAISPDDTVVILGPGAIGLLVMQYARLAHPRRVIVAGLGRDGSRLSLARALGADDVICFDDDVAGLEAIKSATSGRGADVVIQCSDAVRATSLALRVVAPRGRVLIEGYSGTDGEVAVQPDRLLLQEVRLEGVRGWRLSDFRAALHHNGSGLIHLDPLITDSFPLGAYRDALDRSAAGGSTIKVAFQIDDAPVSTMGAPA